jgi:hypothetical protein
VCARSCVRECVKERDVGEKAEVREGGRESNQGQRIGEEWGWVGA